MRRLSFDIPMLMSLLTVLGMILATVGTWPLAEALGVLRWPGLALVYAAGDYRFVDFVRIGVPLNIITGVATCAAISLFLT